MTENNEQYNDLSQEDFEKMLEQSLNVSDNFIPGDSVTGTIVSISGEFAFIDINGKSEAIMETRELMDDKGGLIYKKGDSINAFVVSLQGGEIRLTSRLGKGAVNTGLLEIAYKNSYPVEGKVTGTTKGGYTVSVSDTNCFCPFSQIDLKASENNAEYIDKTFPFKIIQYSERGRNIVLSRRALQEEKRRENEALLKDSLKIGDMITGTVISLQNFGIFVDIGGVEALVPKSEISRSRTTEISTFAAGQTVTAKVIDLDWEGNRITLSIKQTLPEPWDGIDRYSENDTLNGRIMKIIKSGAFVELEPGLEGFIHVSRMSYTKQVKSPEEAVKTGDLVQVKIISINKDEKRIGLQLVTGEADPWQLPENELTGKTHIGIIEFVKGNGANVRLENGMLGYIPRDKLAARQTDIQKDFPVGSEIKVVVEEFDRNNKKLILSAIGALRKEELIELQEYQKNNAPQGGSSLGNLFKDKFDDLQKKINK